jgi:hypothetical protein
VIVPIAGPARAEGIATAAGAVAAGAALLAWPAFANGYPLMFSDTGAFLHQTLGPLMIWDKPWIYGPFLHLFHWRLTLWLPLAAQALALSHLLWLLQRCTLGRAIAPVHVALCGLAALLTAAPFSVALLMPDAFAPATVLALSMLGLAPGRLGRGERLYLSALATFAIASHLSHLPLAAALVATTLGVDLALRRRVQAHRVAAPLLAALALLAATNLAGHGRVAISPHGATFMLARLQDDGPATATLRAHCPREGWTLCAALDRLPMDSDEFLWSPDSPVNRDALGAPRFLGGAALSAEAGEIVAATLRERPLEVAAAMAGNAWRQLFLVEPGDTLGPEWLGQIATRLREGFGAREADAFEASLQARGELREALLPMVPPQLPVLAASVVALAFAGWRARRDADARRSTFALAVLVALAANACATGALSKPHHRYQARIAWLAPIAAALLLLPARPSPARAPMPPRRG